MYVKDLEGNEYPLQATVTNELELNGNHTLSCSIKPTKVNEVFLADIAEMWTIVDHEDVEHKIVYCKRKGEGSRVTVEVKALPLFFDAFDTDRIYEEYNEHMTAAEFFSLVFGGTAYNYALVDSFSAIQWEGLGKGATRLAMFKDGLNRYGAEFRIAGNTIYLETLIGRDTSFMYRHRLNASNIVLENDATAYYTYAKGFGDYAEGEEHNAALILEYTSPLASLLGVRHAPPIYDGRVTQIATMDAKLKTLVDESLKISVSADIHDLRKQGYELAQPELGDRVFLIDERIGLDDEVRVIDMSVTKDWKGNVLDLKLTLGSPGLVRRYNSNLNTAVERINDLIEGRATVPYNVLPPTVKAYSEALKSALTELEFTSGIIAREKDNPNKLVLLNSAGLGVSVDGGNLFKTAITADGIVADAITSGAIYTNNVRIIGEDNYFYWDGNSLTAIDPDDFSRYVELTSSGLYIAKGAMTIERPDGFKLINDGIANFDMSVQNGSPTYIDSTKYADGTYVVKHDGPYMYTVSTAYMRFDYLGFRHTARYLNVMLYGKSEGGGAYVYASIRDENGVEKAATMTNATTDTLMHLTVDLGVPTGNYRHFYVYFKSTSTDYRANLRMATRYLSG